MGEIRIPDKPRYKIGEVCQYTDTQPYVLQFWESEFPQLAPEVSGGGTRYFSRDDIDLILRIKKLLYEEECTIASARKRLEQRAKPKPARAAKRAKAAPASEPQAAPPTIFPTTDGTVDRARYEDALHEIQRLRHELDRMRDEREELTARARKLDESLAARQQQLSATIERLEALRARLDGLDPIS